MDILEHIALLPCPSDTEFCVQGVCAGINGQYGTDKDGMRSIRSFLLGRKLFDQREQGGIAWSRTVPSDADPSALPGICVHDQCRRNMLAYLFCLPEGCTAAFTVHQKTGPVIEGGPGMVGMMVGRVVNIRNQGDGSAAFKVLQAPVHL